MSSVLLLDHFGPADRDAADVSVVVHGDLAVGPDGSIYCFYERGTTDGKSIYKSGALTVAKFNLDWVLGK